MQKLLERFKEPSTYAGLAAIIAGLGQMFDINEAPALANGIATASNSIVGGDYVSAFAIAAGAFAVILKEKSTK